jgi:hypothetical protein
MNPSSQKLHFVLHWSLLHPSMDWNTLTQMLRLFVPPNFKAVPTSDYGAKESTFVDSQEHRVVIEIERGERYLRN